MLERQPLPAPGEKQKPANDNERPLPLMETERWRAFCDETFSLAQTLGGISQEAFTLRTTEGRDQVEMMMEADMAIFEYHRKTAPPGMEERKKAEREANNAEIEEFIKKVRRHTGEENFAAEMKSWGSIRNIKERLLPGEIQQLDVLRRILQGDVESPGIGLRKDTELQLLKAFRYFQDQEAYVNRIKDYVIANSK